MNRFITSAAVLVLGLAVPTVVHATDDPAPTATSTVSPAPTEAPAPAPASEPSAPAPTTAAPSTPPTSADESSPRPAALGRSTLVIIGDSLTALYSNAPGSPSRGWWSYAADELGLTPYLSAESGSGMWARGLKCQGTTFVDRLNELDAVAADTRAIIVAGGRNDFHGCLNGKYKTIYRASTEKAIRRYLEALARKVDALGIDRSRVYVTTLWGSTQHQYATYIWRQQRAVAQELGFKYALVRYLLQGDTIDGTHANARGNRKIWEAMKAGSDIENVG